MSLFGGIELECVKCSVLTCKVYKPPISDEQFNKIKGVLKCPNCHKECKVTPILDEEQIPIPAEDWTSKLLDKYQNLERVANENLPGLWQSLEFELSIEKISHIKDCTLPFAGIVLGRPSSLKTIGIDLFRNWKDTYYTDSFSAKSWVSHSTAVPRDKLVEIDMLPKIKNKYLLTPELSPTFSKKDDDLIEILGILTRVLDGHGYESDSGAHGHRGYNEPMMFVWAGAAVDIPFKVHKLLGTLGYKLHFLRLEDKTLDENKYFNEIGKDFGEKLAKVQVALFDYLNWFEKGPDLEKDEKSGLLKMIWDSEKDDELATRYIIRLAILLAHLRAVVTTWHTDDSDGLGYGYALATIEDPSRAMTQLRNLARGHALSQGRNYITKHDIPLLIKVAFSTASLERVRIFELLLANQGSLTTSQIEEFLNTTPNTAKRNMAEFRAVGLVEVKDVPSTKGSPEKQIILKNEFDWFQSEEFHSVRNLPPYYRQSKLENSSIQKGLGGNFSDTYDLLKCPHKGCNFKNIYQSEIDHHFRLTHPGGCGENPT